jgi:hypothetical protein
MIALRMCYDFFFTNLLWLSNGFSPCTKFHLLMPACLTMSPLRRVTIVMAFIKAYFHVKAQNCMWRVPDEGALKDAKFQRSILNVG